MKKIGMRLTSLLDMPKRHFVNIDHELTNIQMYKLLTRKGRLFSAIFIWQLLMLLPSLGFGYADQKIISVNFSNTSIKDAFKELNDQTGLKFMYSPRDFNENKRISGRFTNTPTQKVLDFILTGLEVSYVIRDNTVIIKKADPARGTNLGTQQRPVSGKVTDDQGNPVAGALVSVKGSTSRVSTTMEGTFTINAEQGAELEVSHVSYFSTTVRVGQDTRVAVALQPNVNLVEQVVVTGYTEYARSKSAAAATQVNAENINGVPMSTLDQTLQGRVPGMNVLSSSGQPGQSASVTIRGIGTINGATRPLVVMDGIPIEAGYLQTINSEDIESVNVLKDASAKALYGSRGANGVIVITTKKGKRGSLNVNYSSQYGISTLTQPGFEMMNAQERLRFEEEVGLETGRDIGPGWRYSSRNPFYNTQSSAWQQNAGLILDSLRNVNTDWRDLFFQDARFMQQQVSLSGGNENIRTYNSLGLWNEDGIVRETGLKRYSLRSNTNLNYGKFTAGINLNLGYSTSKFTYNEGGTSVGSPMASVYYALPYEYPYDADGVFHATNADFPFLDTREGSRGIDVLYGTSDKTEQLKTILGLDMAYEIMDGLKISTRAGVDYRNSIDQVFINPLSYIGSRQSGQKGAFGEGLRRNFDVVSTSGLTYQKTIDQHDFEVSGFFEYLFNNYKSFNYRGYGLDDRLPETPAGITVSTAFLPSLGGGRLHSAMMSYMGVGRYTYDNKYTVTASYRYDGASLSYVPKKNRWHGFYSFGAAWDVKQEEFLSNSDLISVARMRASYGQTASSFGRDNFIYMSMYEAGTTYGGEQALRPVRLSNPDFNWEFVNEFNVGMDLSLFSSRRVNLVVDYYNKVTRNMFIGQMVSATAGAGSGGVIELSSARMQNKGVEFSLDGDVIRTGDFTWNIGVNGAYNQNKILRVTDTEDAIREGDTRWIEVGMPYGTYYAPLWAGVNPDNGEAQYYNRDGSVTNVYNFDEQAVPLSANRYPKFTGGMTTSLRWKDITLDALFVYVTGVQRWNNIDFYNENQAYMTSNQSRRMLYDRWKKPGDEAHLQRIDIPRNFTSKDVQDASFLRLRNLRVNYNIPVAVFGGRSFFKAANVFVQGQNLFTWTSWRGLDPENDRQYGRFEYPNARKYTAGVNVNF